MDTGYKQAAVGQNYSSKFDSEQHSRANQTLTGWASFDQIKAELMMYAWVNNISDLKKWLFLEIGLVPR